MQPFFPSTMRRGILPSDSHALPACHTELLPFPGVSSSEKHHKIQLLLLFLYVYIICQLYATCIQVSSWKTLFHRHCITFQAHQQPFVHIVFPFPSKISLGTLNPNLFSVLVFFLILEYPKKTNFHTIVKKLLSFPFSPCFALYLISLFWN